MLYVRRDSDNVLELLTVLVENVSSDSEAEDLDYYGAPYGTKFYPFTYHITYMTRYAIRNALTRHAIRKRVHNLYFEGGVCGWSQWDRPPTAGRSARAGVNRILFAPNLAWLMRARD